MGSEKITSTDGEKALDKIQHQFHVLLRSLIVFYSMKILLPWKFESTEKNPSESLFLKIMIW